VLIQSIPLTAAIAWCALPGVVRGDDTADSDTILEQGDSSEAPEALPADDAETDRSDIAQKHAVNNNVSVSDNPSGIRWFRHAGIGFRAGAGFREKATSGDFPADYVLGPELYLAVLSAGMHRAEIGAGYLYVDESRENGTYEIRVATSYQRWDLFAGYAVAWKLLNAALRVGTALTVVDVTTTYGEPSWEVVGVGDEAELVMYPPGDPVVDKEQGVSAGFLVGLGVGLAIGHYLFGIDDLIELRAQADYVRRHERDEFALYGMVVFWPTRLIR
jgi:hypothetical protein